MPFILSYMMANNVGWFTSCAIIHTQHRRVGQQLEDFSSSDHKNAHPISCPHVSLPPFFFQGTAMMMLKYGITRDEKKSVGNFHLLYARTLLMYKKKKNSSPARRTVAFTI